MSHQSEEDAGTKDAPALGDVRFDADDNLLTFNGTSWQPLERLPSTVSQEIFRLETHLSPVEPAAGADEPPP